MTLRIYTSDTYIDIDLKDIYTETQIIEAIENNDRVALTRIDNTTVVINTINIIMIDIKNK